MFGSDEELGYKVSETQQNYEGVSCDVQLAQLSLLLLLAGEVDQDGQGEYDGQPTGGSTEPQHSSDVRHEYCEENANYYDGRVQSQNVRESWNYNSFCKIFEE